MAMATACFCGLPAFISALMLCEMAFFDFPDLRGMMLLLSFAVARPLVGIALAPPLRLIGLLGQRLDALGVLLIHRRWPHAEKLLGDGDIGPLLPVQQALDRDGCGLLADELAALAQPLAECAVLGRVGDRQAAIVLIADQIGTERQRRVSLVLYLGQRIMRVAQHVLHIARHHGAFLRAVILLAAGLIEPQQCLVVGRDCKTGMIEPVPPVTMGSATTYLARSVSPLPVAISFPPPPISRMVPMFQVGLKVSTWAICLPVLFQKRLSCTSSPKRLSMLSQIALAACCWAFSVAAGLARSQSAMLS